VERETESISNPVKQIQVCYQRKLLLLLMLLLLLEDVTSAKLKFKWRPPAKLAQQTEPTAATLVSQRRTVKTTDAASTVPYRTSTGASVQTFPFRLRQHWHVKLHPQLGRTVDTVE
jgi:hypothetical protein